MTATTDFNLPAESVLSADLHDRLPDIAAYRKRCAFRDQVYRADHPATLEHVCRNPAIDNDTLDFVEGIWGYEDRGEWRFCLRRATTHQFPANDWHQFASVQEVDGHRVLVWLP